VQGVGSSVVTLHSVRKDATGSARPAVCFTLTATTCCFRKLHARRAGSVACARRGRRGAVPGTESPLETWLGRSKTAPEYVSQVPGLGELRLAESEQILPPAGNRKPASDRTHWIQPVECSSRRRSCPGRERGDRQSSAPADPTRRIGGCDSATARGQPHIFSGNEKLEFFCFRGIREITTLRRPGADTAGSDRLDRGCGQDCRWQEANRGTRRFRRVRGTRT